MEQDPGWRWERTLHCTGTVHHNLLYVKDLATCERYGGAAAAPERSVDSGGDQMITGSRVIGWKGALPRLTTRGLHVVGDPYVDQHHMIIAMIYHLVETFKQLGLAAAVHPALEHRKLYPRTVPVHQLEYLAPALGVGDVVGDDVQVLFHLNGW